MKNYLMRILPRVLIMRIPTLLVVIIWLGMVYRYSSFDDMPLKLILLVILLIYLVIEVCYQIYVERHSVTYSYSGEDEDEGSKDGDIKQATSYPAKLQLAIDAHNHFYSATKTTPPVNAEIKAWLTDESKKREAKNSGRVTSMYGLSDINIRQIVVIIKPDDF